MTFFLCTGLGENERMETDLICEAVMRLKTLSSAYNFMQRTQWL